MDFCYYNALSFLWFHDFNNPLGKKRTKENGEGKEIIFNRKVEVIRKMKTKNKIVIGFTAEIIFFVSVGGFLANGMFAYSLLSLAFAMVFAGYTGKQIEKDAIEKYELNLEFLNKLGGKK